MATGLLLTPSAPRHAATGQPAPSRAGGASGPAAAAAIAQDGAAARAAWVAYATRIAEPVLTNLAAGTLRKAMPVEQVSGARREAVTHLEALGRLLCGLAPWLALPADATAEGRTRGRLLDLARRSIARAVDPASPDAMNFTTGGQPLVDAAFLAHAIVRAPAALGDALDAATRRRATAPTATAPSSTGTTTTATSSSRCCSTCSTSWARNSPNGRRCASRSWLGPAASPRCRSG
jgi:hypothetical protein